MLQQKLDITIEKKDPVPFFMELTYWLGTPYRIGGTSQQRGVDCSGFVGQVFLKCWNIPLSRSSSDMYRHDCDRVYRKSSLKMGDLIFFKTGKSRKINHVGIYLKDDRFIHAAFRGGVRIDRLTDKYYQEAFYRGGRLKKRFL